MGGFRYCGKALSEFGEVYYIPNEEERGDYTPGYEINDAEVEGRDGGYRRSERVSAKEFTLPVFYENLTLKQLNRLAQWFDRRTSGELIFEDRPYAAYTVYPSARAEVRDYRENRDGTEKHHGQMTIHMKAYDPFARLLIRTKSGDTLGAEDEVMLLTAAQTPAVPAAASKSFMIYNPGTERADTIIRLAGDSGTKMTIANKTTGQTCSICGMTSGMTGTAGKVLEISSKTGRVELVGAERELAFELHDDGYITLSPATPFEEDFDVSYTNGSSTISGRFLERMVGQYIYLNGAWRKMTRMISETQMVIDQAMTKTATEKTIIVTMNEIEITGGTLTKLEIEFEPKVR